MVEGWMGWQRGRTIMADLQDTNAATEEIYGPLLFVDCPVNDEMISQSSGQTAVRAKGKLFFLAPAHYLLIRCFGWKPLREVDPGNNTLAVNMTKKGRKEVWEGEWNCQGKSGAREAGGKWFILYVQEPQVNTVHWSKLGWCSCNMQELLWGSHHLQ